MRPVLLRSLLLAAAVPGLAAATLPHARLTGAVPAVGSVGAAPSVLRLTFSERIERKMSTVSLLRGTTPLPALGTPDADAHAPETLIVPVTQALPAGTYTVKYRVAGPDGHPMGGSYTFRVQ